MKRNLLSIKTKLISAFVLGAALTFALPSTSAFAATGEDEKMTIQIESVSPQDEAIYNKQVEIDQYLFKDHAKDIEEKGFKVVQTGVVAGVVEIGITPYSEKSAEYLYSLFGKDIVKIVDVEPAELMEVAITSAPDNAAVTTTVVDKGAATTTASPDTPTTSADDGIMTITSAPGEEIFSTTVVEDNAVKTTAVSESAAVTTTAVQDKASDSSSVLNIAIFTAISVIALGGIFFILNKRKAVK